MRTRLPNLVIAGVAKGGTTTLFHALGRHPGICASAVKELDHFAGLRRGGGRLPPVAGYARHFIHCGDEQPYRMEASPAYFYGGAPVIQAIAATLEDPRIIISLRDPVARFWSAYTFLQSMGRLPSALTCEAYLTACEHDDRTAGRPTPLTVGRYIDHLPAWQEAFGDRLRIVFAEHLFADPAGVVGGVLAWLALPGLGEVALDRHNVTHAPRNADVAAVAYRSKRLTDRLLAGAPGVRRALRDGYRLVNTRAEPRTLPEGVRERLERHYAEPTSALARWLAAQGITDTPPWATTGR